MHKHITQYMLRWGTWTFGRMEVMLSKFWHSISCRLIKKRDHSHYETPPQFKQTSKAHLIISLNSASASGAYSYISYSNQVHSSQVVTHHCCWTKMAKTGTYQPKHPEKVKSLKIIIFQPLPKQELAVTSTSWKSILFGPLKLNAEPTKNCVAKCLSLGDFMFFTWTWVMFNFQLFSFQHTFRKIGC